MLGGRRLANGLLRPMNRKSSLAATIPERNHGLDLLRGLASLGIAIYHYLYMAQGIAVESLGTFGVYLFFMLSGLTMMLVYGSTFSSAIALPDALRFYRNRIARILPLLCAMAALHLALTAFSQPGIRLVGGVAIASFLTGSGLFALHLPGYLSNVMGAWSLGIEVWFYLVFPLVCLLSNNASLRTLLLVIATLILAQQAVLLLLQRMATEDPTRFWHYYTTPLIFAPFFAIGVAVYRSRSYSRVVFVPAGLGLAVLIAIYSVLTDSNPLHSNAHYVVLIALSTAALFFFYRMAVPRILAGLANFLGNASYALYLTHPLVFAVTQRLSGRLGLGSLGSAVLFLLSALVFAHLTHIFFERPVRAAMRREKAAS